MTAVKLRVGWSAAVLARRLFKLERRGRYDTALDEAAHVWADYTEQPDLESLPLADAAELRLRLGALIGFYGLQSQKPGLQDISNDLLTRARREFEELGSVAKTAECDNYTALSYWRKGEKEEADVLVGESLAADLPLSSPIRLYSYIIRCLIRMPDRTTSADNLALLEPIEREVWEFGDDCLKGDYFNHRGIALDNLGRTEEALKNFELARHFHRRSRHRNYLGAIENNLAEFFKKLGDFARAHEAIDNAVKLFKAAKDRTREGFALDTKADLFLAEGRHTEALNCIEKSIAILDRSDNAGYLATAQLTKSFIFLKTGSVQSAILALVDAVGTARTRISEKAARQVADDFEAAYEAARQVVKVHERESFDRLKLLLPEAIAHYDEYRGLRMTNDYLEAYGLPNGALAILARCDLTPGDLAVLGSIDTDDVFCGVYDAFAGIISLEEPTGGEPRLFDDTQVIVLGKIVGRGDESLPASDRIPVRPLEA